MYLIWSPGLVEDIDALELETYVPYEQRLKSLDLYTLFCRCQHSDLIEVYKILNGYYDIDQKNQGDALKSGKTE